MGYNGQRGLNVSEFIANLNTIPPAQEVGSDGPENFNYEAELAMFTNTEFFDFDIGQNTDFQPTDFDFNASSRVDQKPMNFLPGGFAFPEYHPFAHTDGFSSDMLSTMPPLQTTQPQAGYATSSIGSPRSDLVSPQSGEKRKSHDAQYVSAFEDTSRIAAEEDKRRRNTAASARFRVKKKQREQALEKSAKEMSDKVAALEGRINQLETENKWLKNLIVEKNENKDDITALWKKYSQEASETKPSDRKDGVGTANS